MAWKPSWPPAEPDPLRRHARNLRDEEKEVEDKLARLRQELEAIKNPAPPPPKETVWRAPAADAATRPVPAQPAARREGGQGRDGRDGRGVRVHSAQRRRDRARFFLLAAAVIVILIWVARRL